MVLKNERFLKVIRPTQILFATSIKRGIPDRQVLKYQPSVTSRLEGLLMESNDEISL